MATSNSFPPCARFDQFHVDLRSGVLQRSGSRVPVQSQPFQVLRLLLQAEGKVVTREELRKVLWPEDTFVDFELGVNTAVKKLRQALGDPADHAKFIETLPKIGYRFLLPIDWVAEDGQARAKEGTGSSTATAGTAESLRTSVTKKKFWIVLAAAALLLLCAAALLRVLRGRTDQSAALEVVPLVSMAGEQGPPAVSPDGSQVAFSYREKGHSGIYIALVGGGKPLQLTDNEADSDPVWSPDGKALIFPEGLEGGAKARLDLLSLSDFAIRPLSAPLNQEFDCDPAVSPDGTTIAFVRGTMGAFHGDLFVLKVTGGDPIRLTYGNSGGDPAWTQDGKEIVFSAPIKGLRTLWRVPASGGVPADLPAPAEMPGTLRSRLEGTSSPIGFGNSGTQSGGSI